MSEASASAVDHCTHLAYLQDAHGAGSHRVVNLVDSLHLDVVIAGAEGAELPCAGLARSLADL